MKVKILEEKYNFIKLKLSGVTPSFANALRRIMLSEVEIWAIDTVDFYKNECIMSYEEIGNRLGLLPVKVLNENTFTDICIDITSEDTKIIKCKDFKMLNCEFIYPDMPVVILKKNQSLKLVCNLTKNNKLNGGHAKWSPATAVFYNYENDDFYFEIETTGVITPKELFTKAIDILEEKFI